MTPDLQQALQNALAKHQAGQFEEAKKGYLEVLAKNDAVADAHHLLGIIYAQSGEILAAQPHVKKAVDLQPNNPAFLSTYGNIMKDKGFLSEAVDLYERSLAINPQSAQTYYNLAGVQRKMKRFDKALDAAQKSVSLNPSFAEAHHVLATLYREHRELEQAVKHYNEALALKPGFLKSILGLSRTFSLMGRDQEAKDLPREVLSRDPECVDANLVMADIYLKVGDVAAATQSCRTVLAREPENPFALSLLTTTGKVLPQSDLTERLEKISGKNDLSLEEKIYIHFGLGKSYNDLGAHDAAFGAYKKANDFRSEELRLAGHSFDSEKHHAFIKALITTYSQDFFGKYENMGSNTDLPVFILGMPRSGTTLTEQILSSHPEVFGAGERMRIQKAAEYLTERLHGGSYPECMEDLDPNIIRELAATLAIEMEQLGGGALRVCDKMPQNFLHLGLLAILFPNATYIHCRRNPYDTCLSIYFQNFVEPLLYTCDLSMIGQVYREYERLMDHWHQVLPVKVHEVIYENLISDQEGESRRLIEAVGLPWDDACLSFHETRRNVETASNWQVRQPIFKTSTDRWKNYEKFLPPLKEALEGQ